jgi:hypothetical protein
MAMLMLTEVFTRTWGDRAGGPPLSEYWTDVISTVRTSHPGLALLAEVYWGFEQSLLALGFDGCYDKPLLDHLVELDPRSIRELLAGAPIVPSALVRFVENHDEARAAQVWTAPALRAVMVAAATLPGTTLWHEGQFDGRRVRVPVQLGRRPAEPVDGELAAFSAALLALDVRRGDWRLVQCSGWPDDASAEQLLAWTWCSEGERSIVVVNLADAPAHARVHLPWTDLAGRTWSWHDELSGALYERGGDELAGEGLYVALAPWAFHVLRSVSQNAPT